jgi:hypothetical protein
MESAVERLINAIPRDGGAVVAGLLRADLRRAGLSTPADSRAQSMPAQLVWQNAILAQVGPRRRSQ